MHPSSWLRPLLLTGILCGGLGEVYAGDQLPDGLPHEQLTLRDGRRLAGHYDPVMAILWLDGPYRARLRLRAGDIIRRTPLADATPPPMTVAVSTGASRQLTIRLREQQVLELDRRRQETSENIRLLTITLGGLETLFADLGRTLGDRPDPVANAALISQQQQFQQQIGELRRRLMSLDEQLKLLDKRREQAAQVLARARSTPANVAEAAAFPDPMVELRLQALEDEVRALRADNQDLRRQLERLQPPPAAPVQPPSDAAPTTPPTTVPGSQPAADPAAERVAHRNAMGGRRVTVGG